MKIEAKKYGIYIYGAEYSFENYNDSIYQNRDKAKIRFITDSKKELYKAWKKYFKLYGGSTYSVWEDDNLILGGIYGDDDLAIIKNNLS